MVNLQESVMVEVEPKQLFVFGTDYRQMPSWVFGLDRMTPVGTQTHGVGAVYEGAVDLGPVVLRSTAEITEWVEDQRISVQSRAGFTFAASVVLVPDGPRRTRVTLAVNYGDNGLAARGFAKMIEPIVHLGLRHSVANLRASFEHGQQ